MHSRQTTKSSYLPEGSSLANPPRSEYTKLKRRECSVFFILYFFVVESISWLKKEGDQRRAGPCARSMVDAQTVENSSRTSNLKILVEILHRYVDDILIL